MTDQSETFDLAAARARCEAATAGPWGRVLGDQVVAQPFNVTPGSASYKRCIARLDEYDYEESDDDNENDNDPDDLVADAEFIANARTDLPAALDALDRVLALCEDWDTRLPGMTAEARHFREALAKQMRSAVTGGVS